ncbi:MAG: cell division protein ZapE [Gemmatimonadota bacterium]
MPTLESLISSLQGRPDTTEILRQFRPPDRFASKHFDDYHPGHPTQEVAAERLRRLADSISRPGRGTLASAGLKRVRDLLSPAPDARYRGIYLDGGFGVGKTHLLAALWNATPAPKAFLSFDELMYFIGMVGPAGAAESFDGHRLIAIDEWELDDPGNLKMALAFLRGAIERRIFVAVTSNTLPLELGEGRFSQKDFRSEVEELASAFEVVRIAGDDYRHRHFEARPGAEYFADSLPAPVSVAPDRALEEEFGRFIEALSALHPIRYRDLVKKLDHLALRQVVRIDTLPAALRWVHFIDAAYDSDLEFAATASIALGDLFPADAMDGPYGKKFSRCLSRLEEMLRESGTRRGP